MMYFKSLQSPFTICRCVCTVYLFCNFLNFSSAQFFSDYNFKFRTYTVKDGLPHNKINKIVQDSKGFLWIATEGGLSRFDGYSFRNFTYDERNKNSIISNNVLDIAIDKNDELWLACDYGICHFDPQTYVAHEIFFNNTSVSCQNIVYDFSNHMVFAASSKNGLYKIDAVRKQAFKTKLSMQLQQNVTSSSIDSKGIVWLTIERNGYYKYDINQDKYSYLSYYEWPMFVYEDKNRNQYYTGSWLGEFMIFDGNTLPDLKKRYVFPTKFEGYDKITYRDCEFANEITGDSMLWVTSHVGLGIFHLKQNKFIKHFKFDPSQLDGLSNNWLGDIFTSKDGSVWIASWHGLITVNPVAQSFSRYYLPELDINLYNLVSGMVDDPTNPNTTWITVNGTGLAEYDKKTLKIKKWHFKEFLYPTDWNYSKRWLGKFYKDENNVLWSSSYGGFAKIKKGLVSFVDCYVNNEPIYADNSFQDSEGMLWQSGRYLVRLNPNTEKTDYFSLPDSFNTERNEDPFKGIDEGKNGEIFVATTEGLLTLNKNTREFKRINYEIPNIKNSNILNIRDIKRIEDKLYLATYGGLIEYDLKSKKSIRLIPSFIEQRGIAKDQLNNLWVAATDGLYRIEFATQKIDKFTQNDGVFNISSDPIAFFEYNNEMYVGHRSGYTKFNPFLVTANSSLPIPYLTEVTTLKYANEQHVDHLINLKLEYSESDLTFNYTAIEYNYPEKLTFSYLLEGYDTRWSDYTALRSKSYTNLPQGRYTFKVKSKNSRGLESKTIAQFKFEVLPAFWQSWWFKLLSLLCLGCLIYLIAKRRIAKIRKKEEEKTAVNKMIAELDAKLLRSQMNPHFIFNSLNSIQKYIWENNEEEAAEYLAKFAKLMRSILESSTKDFITLEEEFKIMKIYLELEHKRSNGHFDYQLYIDASIDQNKTLTPPLLLQPFIENAIWHGLNKKSSHGNLIINVKLDGNYVIFSVDDDGVGRRAVNGINTTVEKKSMGISITQQRIEKLFESFTLKGSIKIIDKVNNGISSGTCVVISLPIKLSEDA